MLQLQEIIWDQSKRTLCSGNVKSEFHCNRNTTSLSLKPKINSNINIYTKYAISADYLIELPICVTCIHRI